MVDVASVVGNALDEFDDLPIDAVVRRALRVAVLRGDVVEAARFRLEQTQLGAGDSAKEVAKSVLGMIPANDVQEFNELYREGMRRLIVDRTRSDGNVVTQPIDNFEHEISRFEGLLTKSIAAGDLGGIEKANEYLYDLKRVVGNVRSHAFDYLCRAESSRTVSDPVARSIESSRNRVDRLLDQYAPDVRDQLASAVRSSETAVSDAEARSHVLLTCRRVLKTVADVVYPPKDTAVVDSSGVERAVGADQYKNRLLAFFDGLDGTLNALRSTSMAELASRLDKLNELDSKGVHDAVSHQEMEFGLAQTYLIAGEILAATEAAGGPQGAGAEAN